MKIRLSKLVLLLIIFAVYTNVLPSMGDADELQKGQVFYIAPDGRDNAKGTKDDPFNSFSGVSYALGKISDDVTDVTVIFRGGEYTVSEPIQINKKNVRKNVNLTLKAYEGETPEISSAVEIDISKFRPVTDKEVLKVIDPEARDFIGVVDLAEQGLKRENLDFIHRWETKYDDNRAGGTPLVPINLYLNDSSESLAKWPNSSYERIYEVLNEGGRIDPGILSTPHIGEYDCAVFTVDTDRVSRWKTAKNAFIDGFITAEYWQESQRIKSINSKERKIELAKWTQMGVKAAHKYRVINLLEELDIPGEWYIDMDEMLLYYYPRYKLDKKTDRLAIDYYACSIINIDGVDNVTIDGLTLKNCDSGIQAINTKNSNISNCKIFNCLNYGIYADGLEKSQVYANEIHDCGNIGFYLINSGNRLKLESGEVVFHNNHVFNTGINGSTGWDGGVGIHDATCGIVVRNNLIHGIKNYSITWRGNDHVFSHNEVWNGNRETADSMPFYSGRDLSEYGNAMRYNYVHNCVNPTNSVYGNSYMAPGDDWGSGTIIENNILKVEKHKQGTGIGLYTRDNTIRDNIILEAQDGISFGDRYQYIPNLLTSTDTTLSGLFESLESSEGLEKGYAKTPIWQQKYPMISKILPDIQKNNGRMIMQNNVVTGNVCVNAPINMVKGTEAIWGANGNIIENNQEINDYSIFVNPDNHDYRLTEDAVKKYGLSENIMTESNFDMDMIGIQKDVFDVETPETGFKQIYPPDGARKINRKLDIVWEKALYADEYDYIVATDAEFKNVIAKGTTYYNSVTVDGLEHETTYYWTVSARNLSKQIGNEWKSESGVFSFTTSKYDNLNFEYFNILIDNLNEVYKGIVEGENIGDFKPGTKAIIENKIIEAKRLSGIKRGSQDAISAVEKDLELVIKSIDSYRNFGYQTVDMTPNGTEYTTKASNVEYGEDFIRVKEENNVAFAGTNNNYNVLKFKLKTDFGADESGWVGISIKQKNPKLEVYTRGANNYLVVIKNNVLEFQKYGGGSNGDRIITTFPNDGIVKSGEWADVEVYAITHYEGVHYKLIVNGTQIFDYFDTDTANYNSGYFVIKAPTKGVVEVKASDNVPEGKYIPEKPSTPGNTVSESVYHTCNDTAFSCDDTFGEVSAVGYEDNIVLAGVGTAKWSLFDMKQKPYKLYYWFTPVENGDKNALIRYSTTGGISGFEIYEKRVDFSQGEPGWIELLTFWPMSPTAGVGGMTLEVIGSGEGNVGVSAIRYEEASNNEKAFSDFFYIDNKNIMVMKPGEAVYFDNIEKSVMDSQPVIVNDRVLVPLRTISEGFDCEVTWNDTDKTVTINNNKQTLNFKVGSKEYTKDGEAFESEVPPEIRNNRVLVPLRVIAEALGKEVYWESGRRIIVIGDKINISDSTADKFGGVLDYILEKLKVEG